MKRSLAIPLLLMVPLLWGFDPFQSNNTKVEEGNAKLGAGKYKEALKSYDAAAKELPDEAGVQYNRGVALHRLGKFDKAREALSKAVAGQDRSLKARSYYNLGNTLFELKKYKEATDSFKRSLGLRPGHLPSKWNLELSLRRIKEEEKKKKDQKKKDKQKDNNKDKKNKDKQKKDQKQNKEKQGKNDPDKKDQQDKQDKQDKQKEKQDKKKKKQQERSDKDKARPKPQPKERDSVLDALERNDKSLQRQRLRGMMGGRRRKTEKDW